MLDCSVVFFRLFSTLGRIEVIYYQVIVLEDNCLIDQTGISVCWLRWRIFTFIPFRYPLPFHFVFIIASEIMIARKLTLSACRAAAAVVWNYCNAVFDDDDDDDDETSDNSEVGLRNRQPWPWLTCIWFYPIGFVWKGKIILSPSAFYYWKFHVLLIFEIEILTSTIGNSYSPNYLKLSEWSN